MRKIGKLMDKKGYTLIEVIIAVTVLAIVVVPITSLLTQSTYSNIKSKELMLATALAQEKIEELKVLSFQQIQESLGAWTEEEVESTDFAFIRRVEIEQENANLLKIIVKVHGDSEVVRIATYRGRY